MNKPLLNVGPLTNLQDARSSAAVGFDLITFSLERGSTKKLPGSMIWSIIQWLSGPAVVLELNRFSLEELKDIEGVFTYDYLSMPLEEWGEDLLGYPGKLILRTEPGVNPEALAEILAKGNPGDVLFELSIEKGEELSAFSELLPSILVHQKEKKTSPEQLPEGISVYGFSLKDEMEEEPGMLDYEAIDTWIEDFQETFEEA